MGEDVMGFLFGYLDWCKSQGLTLEQSYEHDNAMKYAKVLHDQGMEVNGFHVAIMTGIALE